MQRRAGWPAVVPAAAGAGLVAASAAIHLHLYALGYDHIPTVGRLFLAQGIAGSALAVIVLAWRTPASALLGAGYMASSLGGFLTAVWFGLFGFKDSFAAPFAGWAFAVELAGLVVLVAGAGSVLSFGHPRATADRSGRPPVPAPQS